MAPLLLTKEVLDPVLVLEEILSVVLVALGVLEEHREVLGDLAVDLEASISRTCSLAFRKKVLVVVGGSVNRFCKERTLQYKYQYPS